MAVLDTLEALSVQPRLVAERHWPYDLDRPKVDLCRKPHYRVTGYEQIRPGVEAARSVLWHRNLPFIVALHVIGAPWNDLAADFLPLPTDAELKAARTEGGALKDDNLHAVVLVDHQDGRFLVRNSYGTKWRRMGYRWMAEEYLDLYAVEAWVITGCETVMP